MPLFDSTTPGRPSIALSLVLALTLLFAACSGEPGSEDQPGATAPDPGDSSATRIVPEESQFDFPVGTAVLVPEGYEPPTDRVASTGGYLPANGKPTLVFAESIT